MTALRKLSSYFLPAGCGFIIRHYDDGVRLSCGVARCPFNQPQCSPRELKGAEEALQLLARGGLGCRFWDSHPSYRSHLPREIREWSTSHL